MKTLKKIILIISLLLITSCSTLSSWLAPVAKFDQKSYENLTALKATTLVLIDTCIPGYEEEKLKIVSINYSIIYEYEKGKGIKNYEVTTQLEIFKERLDVFISEAVLEDLSIDYRASKKEVISRMLDIIISTEYAKPR